MKKTFLSLNVWLSAVLIIPACTSSSGYGEKVEINPKSEVYIKDGATKEEAQTLGNFLLHNHYFDNATDKSVQLLHDNDTFVVKFVVNEEKLQNDDQATIGFRYFQTLIRDSVFAGKPTKLILTNADFKEIKTIKEFTKEELEATVDTSPDSVDNENSIDSTNH